MVGGIGYRPRGLPPTRLEAQCRSTHADQADGLTVHPRVPDIAPTGSMEIKYHVESAQGKATNGVIHNTIQKLKD